MEEYVDKISEFLYDHNIGYSESIIDGCDLTLWVIDIEFWQLKLLNEFIRPKTFWVYPDDDSEKIEMIIELHGVM